MTYAHPTTESLIARLSADLPQGILLEGEPGIGLKTLATTIARAITRSVVKLEPDERGTIGIDRVRELYALGRSKGGKTVFIIDDADAMGIEAQNALLKLLEEPVDSVRFILTSHHSDRLLPTIRSRVESHAIRPISSAQSEALLTDLKVTDPTKRAQLLFIAAGFPAALTRFGTTNKLFTERSQIIRDARAFLGGSREDRLLLVANYKDRSTASALLQDMARLLRRTIIANPTPGSITPLEVCLQTETALAENASVRLSLTRLALLI
jgi:hypothetical protein